MDPPPHSAPIGLCARGQTGQAILAPFAQGAALHLHGCRKTFTATKALRCIACGLLRRRSVSW